MCVDKQRLNVRLAPRSHVLQHSNHTMQELSSLNIWVKNKLPLDYYE